MSGMLGNCCRCSKKVYSQEGFIAVKLPFHKGCFKCEVCNWQLSLTTYKSINDKVYCKNHFPVGGLSVPQPEQVIPTTGLSDVVNNVAMNAPKVNNVNEQIRGGNEKPQTGINDLVTANALKAPKVNNVNDQVRGGNEKPQTGIDDLVTANALKAPKVNNVNDQIRGQSTVSN